MGEKLEAHHRCVLCSHGMEMYREAGEGAKVRWEVKEETDLPGDWSPPKTT